jgi:hypothetical protein
MAAREHPETRRWREQSELHLRQVQRLMFQNAQLVVMVGALLPALLDEEGVIRQPRCISCGITLPPRSTKYCSGRCNQRAWRLRKRAA